MPWFRLDDGFYNHPKVLAAGNAAVGVWTRAAAYCAQQLTEGFVPARIARDLGTIRQLDRLVDVGLLERCRGGYRVHDYLEHNPTRQKILDDRAAAADRKRRSRTGPSQRDTDPMSQRDSEAMSHPPHPIPSQADDSSSVKPNITTAVAGAGVRTRTRRNPQGKDPDQDVRAIGELIGGFGDDRD